MVERCVTKSSEKIRFYDSSLSIAPINGELLIASAGRPALAILYRFTGGEVVAA
jgi:hypothetical protein